MHTHHPVPCSGAAVMDGLRRDPTHHGEGVPILFDAFAKIYEDWKKYLRHHGER
ncbi:hypothetical protein [uncultured Sphingomonas sp.]|uniref:hypothetical protein n=1 Tax=uncultured Sphingomonas sp. TaxID=158754 RepID=UPI00261B9EF5|nr:hypothetical protein [uncultured Sphingomonas sp.]